MELEQVSRSRPATWLEIVSAARSNRSPIEIHPVPANDGVRMTVSLASRLLCSNDGRVTVFEDQAAAVRFLSVAGVRKWRLGAALQGMAGLVVGGEHLRLRGGRLSA